MKDEVSEKEYESAPSSIEEDSEAEFSTPQKKINRKKDKRKDEKKVVGLKRPKSKVVKQKEAVSKFI